MKIFSGINFKIQKIFSTGPVREGGRNPYVDWMVILILCVVITISLVVNSVYLYNRVSSGLIQGTKIADSSTNATFDVSGLDYIIEKFNSKSDKFVNTKKGYQAVADPSL